ncbi:MAG: hypothetical protein EP299_13335 [Acidobacteria bacterium]|nr:MAG: hypothetical protein EP299_13335 [Acidobacteriota bacterium]
MSCGQFDLWIVSDDPADRERALIHAAGCPRCGEIARGQDWLAGEAESWRGSVEAPAGLENRIRLALGGALPEPDIVPEVTESEEGSDTFRRSLVWGALAASFLVGAAIGLFQFRLAPRAPEEARTLLVADQLDAAREVERERVREIATLERAVAPVLAQTRDPKLASQRASRLLEYQDRLAFLDSTISDARGFVSRNPGHAGARDVLLSAYRDKTDVLREVLALEERSWTNEPRDS